MLNNNKITDKAKAQLKRLIPLIKEKPRQSAIAGLVLIVLIIIMSSLLRGGKDELTGSTFAVRKGPLRISVTENGNIQARERIIVTNQVEGNTSILYIVEEGTEVKKGDLLVELDSSNLSDQEIDQEIRVQNTEAAFISARENLAVVRSQTQSDVDKAQLAFDFSKQDLEKYIDGEYPNQLKQAESRINLAEEEYTRAKDRLEWSTRLFEEKYLSQMELQADELAEKQQNLNLELARNELDLLENYTHKRQLIQLESDVNQAEMALERATMKARADIVQAEANLKANEAEFNRQKDRLDRITRQLERTKIYAPADGLVLFATSVERAGRFGAQSEPLAEGSTVRERQELIHLPTTAGFNAEVGIHEASLDKIRTGLPVIITVDALPGQRFTGRVVNVAPVPDAMSSFLNPDLKVYNTTIEIENSGDTDLLRSGMGCAAEIIVEQHRDTVYIPVQAVIRVENRPTVYVVRRNRLVPRQVQIGLDNNRMIRIIDGLREGEVISLAPPLTEASVIDDHDEIAHEIPPLATKPYSPEMMPAPVQGETGRKKQPETGQQPGFGGPMGETQGPRTRDNFIKMMDKDGDGKISRDEFSGPDEFFDNIDINGDGYITIDEVPDFSNMGAGQPGFGGREGSMGSGSKRPAGAGR